MTDRQEYTRTYNEAHREQIRQFNKDNSTSVNLWLSNKTDADIIEWLNRIPEKKASYIKRLIRQDMNK